MFLREIQLMGKLKRDFTGAHDGGASGAGVSKMLHLPCLLIVREEHPVNTGRRIPPKAPLAPLTPQPEPPPLHIQRPFTLCSWCVFLLSHPRPHCCVVGNDLSSLHSAPGLSDSTCHCQRLSLLTEGSWRAKCFSSRKPNGYAVHVGGHEGS